MNRRRLERFEAEDEARVEIHHSQRIAVLARPSSKSELPLEISCPDEIGLGRFGERGVEMNPLLAAISSSVVINESLSL